MRRRQIPLVVLLLLGIGGFVLVMTAPADGPPMESVTTDEGLDTKIPEGWQRSEQFAFEFVPDSGVAQLLDKWTIARACGPAGCERRTLDEWLGIGTSLPTFLQALVSSAELDVIRDEFGEDYRVLEARTGADAPVVFVAAFTDGADFYIECGVTLGLDSDFRLLDEILDVCRQTK
ncbi:MAG: hypothetical protein GWP48_06530 [Actinobacteria bacterium]|nr:hypothetical protein [Actinomycetota bacterium]